MSPEPIPLRQALRPVRPVGDLGALLLHRFEFAAHHAALRLGKGWGLPETTMRWTIGARSDMIVMISGAHPGDAERRVMAVIEAVPYLAQNPRATQRITVTVNGVVQYEMALSRPGLVAFFIPDEVLGQPITISLEHPDALAPVAVGAVNDRRKLAFACRALQIWSVARHASAIPAVPHEVAGTPAELLGAFESLGDNCEFGIAQRLSGCEPLGLLRFTATTLASLIDLLLHEAAGIGDPATIELDLRGEPPEYILTEQRYNLTYHTFVYADQMPPARVRHREAQKLTLLRRRMLDDLKSGRRIYVVKHNARLREEDVIALFLLLRHYGPNRLLYVAPADAAHAAGAVELLMPGLARGYIDRFAPYDNAADVSLDCWLAVCRQAARALAEGGAR